MPEIEVNAVEVAKKSGHLKLVNCQEQNIISVGHPNAPPQVLSACEPLSGPNEDTDFLQGRGFFSALLRGFALAGTSFYMTSDSMRIHAQILKTKRV